MRFWLGGYGADMEGAGDGIGTLLAGSPDDALAGGPLSFGGTVGRVDSPSWVAAHPTLDVLYVALEGAGAVRAFRRTGEASFVPLGDQVAAGELTCHVSVAPDGGSLLAACWGDGRLVRMDLDAAGRPWSPTIAAAATDPYGPDAAPAPGTMGGDVDLAAAARALREAAGDEYAHLVPDVAGLGDGLGGDASDGGASVGEPSEGERVSRAHESVFLPNGLIASTDMGLDLVRFWTSSARGLRAVSQVVLPRGAGPRHMVWHPSGHLYVITELSHEVFVLAPDAAGVWRVVGGSSLGAGVLPDDTAAELAPARDGEFLYAGVRGSNTIATLRVRDGGVRLEPVALVDAGVDWPRHHVVVRDTLLVAGQLSDEVASLTLDERTGVPGRVRHRTAAPSPTCILPARR